MKRVYSTLLVLVFLLLLTAPIITLILTAPEIQWLSIKESIQSEQLRALGKKTASIAAWSSFLTVVLGVCLSSHIRATPKSIVWFILYGLCFLTSPYFLTQGWINAAGSLNFTKLLHSTTGLIALQTLYYLPFTAILISLTLPSHTEEQENTLALCKPNIIKKLLLKHSLYRFHLLSYFTLFFWLNFWQYEMPSMLRQTNYCLGLYAAFGSFFDYNQALGYTLYSARWALLTLPFLLFLKRGNSLDQRNLQPKNKLTWLRSLFLFTPPLLVMLIPSYYIIQELPDGQEIFQIYKNYTQDIKNTAYTSSIVALVTSLLCYILSTLFDSRKNNLIHFVCISLLITTPTILIGITTASLCTYAGISGTIRQFLAIGSAIFPLLLFSSTFLLARNSTSQQQTLKLSPLHYLRAQSPLIRKIYLPRYLVLCSIGVLLALKEVTSSLLNYPPGGSTLVLSIETMLHFDQKELVTTLCLFQLIFGFIILSPFLLSYHLLRR